MVSGCRYSGHSQFHTVLVRLVVAVKPPAHSLNKPSFLWYGNSSSYAFAMDSLRPFRFLHFARVSFPRQLVYACKVPGVHGTSTDHAEVYDGSSLASLRVLLGLSCVFLVPTS